MDFLNPDVKPDYYMAPKSNFVNLDLKINIDNLGDKEVKTKQIIYN